MPSLRAALIAGVVFLMSACSSPIPTEPEQLTTAGGSGPLPFLCVEGCLDPDPDPDAPGVYLPGLNLTPAGCHDPNQLDSDADGLSDTCELQFTAALAPALSFYDSDQVDRETRWFAHPIDFGYVRLGYLLGYYYDVGNVADFRSHCQTALTIPLLSDFFDWVFGGGSESCLGHLGDSEWIALDIRYNPVSKHWVLQHARLSAHGQTRLLEGAFGSHPLSLSYPEKAGGYPLVWVADGKHANYESNAACDSGGFLGADECYDSPRYVERANVMASGGNIGSWQVQLIDGVQSINPQHPAVLFGPGTTRTEYYFTPSNFYGWYPGTGAHADGYASILDAILPNTYVGLP
jgi:hypothetical protein